MRQFSHPRNANETQETEKAPFLVAKRIRESILDEIFKPGDHLGEGELAERFEVSRSPVREAFLALETEGTVIITPNKGAIVRPRPEEEPLDIAELTLTLISLALKPACRPLWPADFDRGYNLAKGITRSKNSKDHLSIIVGFGTGFSVKPNDQSCAKCSDS